MGILQVSVRLPSDILEELGALTGHRWNSWELEPIICDAIRGYMNPPAPATQEAASANAEGGYQWKQLFLPAGTRLRASFGRVPYFAVVKDAEIRFGELAVTPSGFANLQGSGNRNAWKAVWLRFPGNEQWVLADVCRTKQKTAIARLFAGADYVAADSTATPARPARPVAPAKSEKPAKPATSAKPAKSANPSKPSRPAHAASPALRGGKPNHSVKSGRRGGRKARPAA